MSAVVLLLALGASGTAIAAPAPPARNPDWNAPTQFGDPNLSLSSVSCPTPSFCAAVGDSFMPDRGFLGRALTYNGTAWSALAGIDGRYDLVSVSCPSASFCGAVDASGRALSYNGKIWSAGSVVDAGSGLTSISCPSELLCTAVDDSGNAVTSNGVAWTPPQLIDNAPGVFGQNAGLTADSCPTTSFCVALDGAGNALTYNGGSWSAPVTIDADSAANPDDLPTELTAVSCQSAFFCVAVGDGGNAYLYNGYTWSLPENIDPGQELLSVSCSSAFCAAVDGAGRLVTYNGSAWTAPVRIDPAAGPSAEILTGVSCGSVFTCVAVDNGGQGLTYVAGRFAALTQVKALLMKLLTPTGRAARIGMLFKHGRYPLAFTPLVAGRLVISWYLVPRGGHLPKVDGASNRGSKAMLVATTSATLAANLPKKGAIKLTRGGARLLKHAAHLKLRAWATFTGVPASPVSKTKTIMLRR